jgi:hypothetical protein
MRCLHKVYGGAGKCDVCGMALVKLEPKGAPEGGQLKGYTCPMRLSTRLFDTGGICPFCHLQLRPFYASALPQAGIWPELGDKTALYLRPYEVKPVSVVSFVRGAGKLSGRRLVLRLGAEARRGLRPGLSAMIAPPEGYSKPVLGSVESLGPGDEVRIAANRPLPGVEWAAAEIRLASPPVLAVPLPALLEEGGSARVFVAKGESFEPREVRVTARGESLAAVSGLAEGEVVAGSGAFWLDAQWRMEHP